MKERSQSYLTIYVQRIKEEGTSCVEEVPSEFLDINSDNFHFPKKVNISYLATILSKEILVQGKFSCKFESECRRCLGKVCDVMESDFTFSYAYENQDFIDLTPDIRDEILLTAPTSLLCSEDCLGLCIGCKINLNIEKCHCEQKNSSSNPFSGLEY